jgi:peptidylprolyl isomerase
VLYTHRAGAYTARMRFSPLLLILAACSGGGGGDAPDAGPPVDAAYGLPAGYTRMPFLSDQPMHSFTQPDQVIDVAKDYVAVLDTDAGQITLQLLASDAPITCNSFVFLTLHHFYDDVAFHRVIDGFMAQTGDPNSISGTPDTWGSGGPGYHYGLEVTPSLNYDAVGVVGMARTSDPDSNGSQFFITFGAQHSLDQQYTIWAKVTGGLEVLPAIARGEPPSAPTRIRDAYVGERSSAAVLR